MGAYRIPWEPAFSLENTNLVELLCGLSVRLESNLVAQSFQSADEIALQAICVEAIKVIAAKIAVVALILLQTINDDQNAMGHCYDGAFLSTPGSKAAKLHR